MRKKIAIVIAFTFLAIALIYSTYAIFQSMTDDVRHSLDPLKNAPESVKEFFRSGGWDIDAQVNQTVETTTIRNQIGMTFLIIVEVVCILIAMTSMLLSKD